MGGPNGDIWGLPGGLKEAAPSRTTLRRVDVGGRGGPELMGVGVSGKAPPDFRAGSEVAIGIQGDSAEYFPKWPKWRIFVFAGP